MSPAEVPVVVDRVEEGWAVLEVAVAPGPVQWVEVPVAALPPGTGEGDTLRLVPASWSSSGAGMPAVSRHGAGAWRAAAPEGMGAERPEGEQR